MRARLITLLILAVAFIIFLSCSSQPLPDKGVTIVSPKANDMVKAGEAYEILWKAEPKETEFGTAVTIEFSKDGGKTWERLGENIPNTGKYSWSVPKIDSAQCKILINSQYRPKYRKTSDVFTVK